MKDSRYDERELAAISFSHSSKKTQISLMQNILGVFLKIYFVKKV